MFRPIPSRRRVLTLWQRQDGAVSMMFGLVLFLLLLLMGGVIDFGLSMVSRTRAQGATDASALAAATAPNGLEQQRSRRYFLVNYPSPTANIDRPFESVRVDIRRDRVEVESNANLQTKLLQFGEIDEVASNALTIVSRDRIPVPPDLDMVLVLDVSGSMKCGIDQDSVRYNLPNSCYPYSLAEDEDWYTLPTSAPLRKDQMLPAAKDLVARILSARTPVVRAGLVTYSSQTMQTFGLDSNPDNVQSRIDGVSFEGSTCGACGMKSAGDILTASSPGPVSGRPDGQPFSQVRHVVFLTDGEQNCRFPGEPLDLRFGRPSRGIEPTHFNCEFDDPDWAGEFWTGALRIGDTTPLNDLRDQCNALKAQGITISTIAFGPDVANPSSLNSNTLRDCASPKLDGTGAQFYLADNYDELIAAFTEIGITLGRLRITR
jgi:Flp pilus assembly protein TadG